MAFQQTDDKVKTKQERTKAAITLAMQNRWPEAISVNQTLIDDFPGDLESYNRLGRALTETGRIEEARDAFRRVLEVSPHNTIARKNLDRLEKLGDDLPRQQTVHRKATRAFIGESGKTLVTSLVNVAPLKLLARLTPGDDVSLELSGRRLNVKDDVSGEELGQVESKTASRLKRLMSGGNRYQATVKSVEEREVTIIIREVYKHPSQARIVSFPSKSSAGTSVPSASPRYDSAEDEQAAEAKRINAAKDWSDDDTEPGDDEAFSPSIHRIINSSDEDF